MGLFSRSPRIRGNNFIFEPKNPQESTEQLSCPGCGLFAMYTLKPGETPDLEKLRWSMTYPLVLIFFQIGEYRDRDLDGDALEHMDQVLAVLRDEGKDIILRIAYDNTGNGLAHEPGSFGQITDHIRQMGPLLEKYSSNILIFQGLLLGSWGEMHGSRYLGTDRMRELAGLVRGYLGPAPYMAFRRPMQYRRLYPKVTRLNRTGLFNDGMFGADDDMGTFGVQSSVDAGWTNPWAMKEERAFIAELSKYAPVGGETVLGDHKSYPYSLSETIAHLRGMHISYINSEYDKRVYDSWVNLTYEKKDAWKKTNGKDYIFRHIGYRLRLEKIEARAQEDELTLALELVNDGFARPYRRFTAALMLEDQTYPLSGRIMELAPGKRGTLTGSIPMRAGSLFLALHTDRGERIPLANKGDDDRGLLLGTMK